MAPRTLDGYRWSVGSAVGLRHGEALGLRWSYLDPMQGRVHWQLQRLNWRHRCEDPPACGENYHHKGCRKNCIAHQGYKRAHGRHAADGERRGG